MEKHANQMGPMRALVGDAGIAGNARHHASPPQKDQVAMNAVLMESCPFGIYVVDAEFCVSFANRQAREGAFSELDPILGRPFVEVMHHLWPSAVADDVIERFRHTLQTGESYHSRAFVHQRVDKGIREGYEWEIHQISAPDGCPAVACYYFESTPMREAEAMLRESEERFRTLADRAPVFIWMSDTTGDEVWVNRSMLDYAGAENAVELSRRFRGDRVIDDSEAGPAAVREQREGMDLGTKVTSSVPLSDAPGDVPKEDTPATAACRVIVADDNRDAADMIGMLLRHLGNDVQVAYSGAEAIALMQECKPEVAFLDIGMPGMNGHDVCRWIREQEWGAEARVYAVTGWGQEADIDVSRRMGFTGHLVKPVDLARLMSVLNSA